MAEEFGNLNVSHEFAHFIPDPLYFVADPTFDVECSASSTYSAQYECQYTMDMNSGQHQMAMSHHHLYYLGGYCLCAGVTSTVHRIVNDNIAGAIL